MTTEAVNLKEEFDSIGIKPSDLVRADQIAEEMGIPVSHVIGIAAGRLFRQCGKGDPTAAGSAESRILGYQKRLVEKEKPRSTSIYLVVAVLEQIKKYCTLIGADYLAFFGCAISEYWDYRHPPDEIPPKASRKKKDS